MTTVPIHRHLTSDTLHFLLNRGVRDLNLSDCITGPFHSCVSGVLNGLLEFGLAGLLTVGPGPKAEDCPSAQGSEDGRYQGQAGVEAHGNPGV